ncbi:hypothetical protein BDZ97DRAFT_1924320 [Flammula alnicola]|nr:hypothetical protein BDZ97DRAFT_1924320 [Flammula alnicola]
MATISADSDHSTTISSCSLIGTTLSRLKDATLQFDADYLRPGAAHSVGLDVIRQLAADACVLHLSPEYIAAHPDYTLDKNPLHTNDFASEAFRIGLFASLSFFIMIAPTLASLSWLVEAVIHLQNIARHLSEYALFDRLHRFLVDQYITLRICPTRGQGCLCRGLAAAATIRAERQFTPFEYDPILFDPKHGCPREVFLTDILRLLA